MSRRRGTQHRRLRRPSAEPVLEREVVVVAPGHSCPFCDMAGIRVEDDGRIIDLATGRPGVSDDD